MKKLYTLVCIGFFIYVPVALTYRVTEDFSHPGTWVDNPQFDPRMYLPVLGLTVVIVVFVIWRVTRESRRQENIRRRLENAVHSFIEDRQSDEDVGLRRGRRQ